MEAKKKDKSNQLLNHQEINKSPAKAAQPFTRSSNHFPVVGIGASAGGLDAFKKLLRAIPENSGMAFVLVQHLDPKHESMLPELLQKVTNIPVSEISDDIKVQPNHIYIIPSNKMMIANDGVLLLSPRTTNKNERNLPVDLFFTSLAEVHQSHSIGVVLSGTASDGTKGLKAIKEHGGITFAQDEESAAYDGMPHSAIQAGVVDFVLPPGEIPKKLLEITKIINGNGAEEENIPKEEGDVYKQMLSLLRIRKGTDFTYYKQTTILRRILRRMALTKIEEPAGYLTFLRENKPEQDILFQNLLIPVTSFFRDTKSFDNLCETVFPQLLKNNTGGEPLRLWVAGCSTGQEVYSVAICLTEFLGEQKERVQIFATDISEPAIAKARSGIYSKIEVDGLSPQRLHEFFIKTNGSYQVNKSIRDICLFAVHNFVKDPPFAKLDFISCRNVLIYMEPYLQKKALTTFHYALNNNGYLLLGKSETISSVPELFGSAVKSDKIFSRKDVPGRFMTVTSHYTEKNLLTTGARPLSDPEKSGRNDFQKTADDIILSKYTPAGVVVNEAMDIVHFRGKTGDYLEQLPGKPSHNLLKMAKEGLAFELRNILHKAKKDRATVIKENIPVQENGSLRNIALEAMPLPDTIEPHYLVLFHERELAGSKQMALSSKQSAVGSKQSAKQKNDDKDLRIAQLEKELAQTREDMRSISEDQEAVNEELQSANEELLSGSEELQSLNEEMETSKEELQSTNEELTVVNQEMIGLNEQVSDARDYAEGIVSTIREPLLVLDKNLRVKSANSAFYKTFHVNELDTEGRFFHNLADNQWNIPELRTLLEEILPQKTKFADFEITQTFQNMGERVMLLNAREITRGRIEEKLILLAIEDITEKATARKKIEDSNTRYHNLLMKSPFAFSIMKGKDMVITVANDLMKNFWGKGNKVEGKTLLQVLPELKGQPFPGMIDRVYTTGNPVYANEILARLKHNGKMEERYFNIVYQPHFEADETISGVITIAHEVTDEVVARKKIEESEMQFSTLANNIHNLAWMANADGWIFWYNNRWYEYTGTTPAEMEGWGWKAVHDPEQLPLVMERWQQCINTGEPFEMTFPLKGADNKFRSFLTRVEPMRKEGKVIRWVGTNTDITEQKETQALLEYRKALLEAHNEASVDGLLLVDSKGKIISYNQRFIEIWNMPQHIVDEKNDETALAFAMTQLVHPEQFIEKVKYLYANPKEISIDELEYKDGKIVERHGYPVLAPDGSYYAWSWTFRDITEARNADKEIRQSEENFRQLADVMPDKVTTTDAEGNVTYFNQKWLDFTGLSFDELKGWGREKIIHPDDLKVNLPLWKQALAEGKSLVVEERLLNKKGSYCWHLSRVSPVKDDNKKITKWISATTEIHQQKEQTEKLETAVNERTQQLIQANEELQQKNQEIALSKYNKRFLSDYSEKFSAYKGHNEFFGSLVQFIADTTRLDYIFVGKLEQTSNNEFSIQTIALSAFGKPVVNINYALPEGPCEQVIRGTLYSYPEQCRHLFPNNKTIAQFNVEGYIGYPLYDDQGAAIGLIAVMHEKKLEDPETVSSILKIVAKRAEIELERIKQEELLVQHNEILQEKNEELSKMNAELESFTYVASHDLQEPLRKIQTFAGRLQEGKKEQLSEEVKADLARINTSANRMRILIDDLLNYSRIVKDNKSYLETDLNKIVADVLIDFDLLIAQKAAVIEIEELPVIEAIPLQMSQLFYNLIANALKFAKKDIPPVINITASRLIEAQLDKHTNLKKEIEYFEFVIKDNGIGFNQQYAEQVFTIFQRLNANNQYAGTGIGLAMCRKIALNHGGEIYAEAMENEGAVFHVILPVRQGVDY